jgi:hypothetical protein
MKDFCVPVQGECALATLPLQPSDLLGFALCSRLGGAD